MCMSFLKGEMKMLYNLIVVIDNFVNMLEINELWVNSVICELYFNGAILKNLLLGSNSYLACVL